MSTLTAANSTFTVTVPAVFPSPQQIQGYAADDAFDTAEVKPSDTRMGVDGLLSGGYIAYPTLLTFVLMANSPSIAVLEQLLQAMDSAQETYQISATIQVPGLGKQFVFNGGFLTGSKKTPGAKKLMEAQRYEITFQNCQPQPL